MRWPVAVMFDGTALSGAWHRNDAATPFTPPQFAANIWIFHSLGELGGKLLGWVKFAESLHRGALNCNRNQ
jgi:hypothetical protein